MITFAVFNDREIAHALCLYLGFGNGDLFIILNDTRDYFVDVVVIKTDEYIIRGWLEWFRMISVR